MSKKSGQAWGLVVDLAVNWHESGPNRCNLLGTGMYDQGEGQGFASPSRYLKKASLKDQIAKLAAHYKKDATSKDTPKIKVSLKEQIAKQVSAQIERENRRRIEALPEIGKKIIGLFEGRIVAAGIDSGSFEYHRQEVEAGFRETRDLWYPRKKGSQDGGEENRNVTASISRERLEGFRQASKTKFKGATEDTRISLFPSANG